MRTRKEIKAIGKSAFKAMYWPCVGASFLGIALSLIFSALLSAASEAESTSLSAIIYIANFLVAYNLVIGLNYFYVQRILGHEGITALTPFRAGFTNYGRKLGGCLWMGLFLFLWGLLLYIPGVIKFFSYALTPYILADCPNVKARDALKLSMRIMKGKKGQLFGFYLSFIGWGLLSILTCGILTIFYVNPYLQSSMACWYLEAREDALRNGVITLGQLEGSEPV